MGTLLLWVYRHKLSSRLVMSYLLIFYQGLRPNRFYWEFCNILRKIFLVMVNVFMNTDPVYKSGAALIIVLAFMRWQKHLRPYKREFDEFNAIEQREMLATVSTLYMGILFVSYQSQVPLGVSMLSFAFIVAVNVWFWAGWVCMAYELGLPK